MKRSRFNKLNTFFKNTMKVVIEEELEYTKYDYRNKDYNNLRNGEYKPQIIRKYQNTIGKDLDAKIISIYVKGMTTNDIESHIEEIYGYQVSDSSITRITDKILLHHVRSEGQVAKEIGIKSYRSFKYILKEEFKCKRMKMDIKKYYSNFLEFTQNLKKPQIRSILCLSRFLKLY